MYIHQLKNWPNFTWDSDEVSSLLGAVRHQQGKILGQMQALGFGQLEENMLVALTMDALKTSEIEGEFLHPDQVRSSIARRLGIEIAGAIKAERDVEGVVEMLLDATQNYNKLLTEERLFDWHAALFPTGRSGMHKIITGAWRDGTMQVTSGAMGKEIIHFEAPNAEKLPTEMKLFLDWVQDENKLDKVQKAALAHLWFVTIHPFDDGNGRIARAITDMFLAQADESPQRFYSMSAQIQIERNTYYSLLESTQKGDLDCTEWIVWFLNCLLRSMKQTDETIAKSRTRTKFWEVNKTTVFNARQQKIVQLLLDDFFGNLNVSKYAKITKTSTDTALRDLQDLVKKDVLEQVGKGRSTSYRVR
jgi:Fic family protein